MRRTRHREHTVEAILDAMVGDGWQVLRDLPTSQGAVARLVTGPGGVFAIEARTQPGLARLATVPTAWLRQTAAQARAAEQWLGAGVVPLLVLCHAELDRPGAERDGVAVVGARDLAWHLRGSARSASAAAA